MDKKQRQIAVVMVPYTAQGHLNQLLHLSRLISAYNLPLHFIGTTTHIRQANLRIHGGWDPLSISNLHFHPFPVPSFPSPPPNPNAAVRFPSHLIPSFKAATHLREPFMNLLSDLSHTHDRIVVVHDYLMSSVVQDLVLLPNVEAYMFQSCSAFTSFWYQWEATQSRGLLDSELETILAKLPSLEGCFSDEFVEILEFEDTAFKKISSGSTLYDTCKVLEAKYLELLKADEVCSGETKNWAVGPLNPVVVCNRDKSGEPNKLLDWLDEQEANSVVYVSFGTTVSLTDEETKEIAMGLEESGQKFIWVVRDADKGDIFAGEDEDRRIELPEGYEERVEKRGVGMVVRGWAPQLEILGHKSTGGFMSHCGWNSCMEGITMGVPIAAWPMHSDQPRNAMLIKEVLRTGIYAREWGRRKDRVAAAEVAEVVRRLMDSEEGDGVRKRAAEVGGAVRRAAEGGGATRMELDSFVAHITR